MDVSEEPKPQNQFSHRFQNEVVRWIQEEIEAVESSFTQESFTVCYQEEIRRKTKVSSFEQEIKKIKKYNIIIQHSKGQKMSLSSSQASANITRKPEIQKHKV